MTHPVDATVKRTTTVQTSQQHAFDVFTAQLGTWWPKDYSISEAGMADFIVEPRAGGRWYELSKDGKECETGRVIAFEPPGRLVLAWHLTGTFQYDPDPARASEVEVQFIAEGPNQTRVELEHRLVERHSDADTVRGIMESPQGWSYVLEQFAKQGSA